MEKNKRGDTKINRIRRTRNLREFLTVTKYMEAQGLSCFTVKELNNYYRSKTNKKSKLDSFKTTFATNYKIWGHKLDVKYGQMVQGTFRELGKFYDYELTRLSNDHLNLRIDFNPKTNEHEVQKIDIVSNRVMAVLGSFPAPSQASVYIRAIYTKEGTLKSDSRVTQPDAFWRKEKYLMKGRDMVDLRGIDA